MNIRSKFATKGNAFERVVGTEAIDILKSGTSIGHSVCGCVLRRRSSYWLNSVH